MRWRRPGSNDPDRRDLRAVGLMLMSMDEKLDAILEEVRDDDVGEEQEETDRP